MSENNETVSLEDALLMLSDGEKVHTFRSPGVGIILGADWDRAGLIQAMTDAKEILPTGETAQAIHHGLAIRDKTGLLFIETKRVPA
ncbi:MAG: hypothetical protein NUV75_02140 [Gallionella sp.]|nr:hypothetical protein [Gallionella sp.]